MKNLGLERRHQFKPGAIERAKSALAQRSARESPASARFVVQTVPADKSGPFAVVDSTAEQALADPSYRNTYGHRARFRSARRAEAVARKLSASPQPELVIW
jgi:hypothetical protein